MERPDVIVTDQDEAKPAEGTLFRSDGEPSRNEKYADRGDALRRAIEGDDRALSWLLRALEPALRRHRSVRSPASDCKPAICAAIPWKIFFRQPKRGYSRGIGELKAYVDAALVYLVA
jgi:hypothetical protein